jgi:hypothetical protein
MRPWNLIFVPQQRARQIIGVFAIYGTMSEFSEVFGLVYILVRGYAALNSSPNLEGRTRHRMGLQVCNMVMTQSCSVTTSLAVSQERIDFYYLLL